MNDWVVWVGGGEVTDYYVNKRHAEALVKWWKEQGYEDVHMEKVTTKKE